MYKLLVTRLFMDLTTSMSLTITERQFSLTSFGEQVTDHTIHHGIGDIIQPISLIGRQCQCIATTDMFTDTLTTETDMYILKTEECQEPITYIHQ